VAASVKLLLHTIYRYRLHDRYRWVDQLRKLYELGELGGDMAEMHLHLIQPLIAEQEKRPNLLFRAPEFHELYPDGPPPLVIGHLEENEDVPLGLVPKGAFHCIFVGTTGAGKTVAIRCWVVGIEELNQHRDRPIVVLILDYKGTSFSDFQLLFGNHWRHYDVHGALRLALQPPSGVSVPIWINHIATSFCARAGLIAGWVTLANLMRWLVSVMNRQPAEQLVFPDFQLLLEVAYALPKKAFAEKTQYLESLIQYLEGVTQASGDLFRAFNGLDLERDLISKGLSAVISIPSLSPPWLNQFVAELFVLQLLLGRTARQQRGDDPEVLLVLDDCDSIVSRDNERLFPTDMPAIVKGLRLLRGYRVGIGLGVGALSPVSEQVLNSVAYHFVFRNPHDNCANAAKRTLGLPPGSQTLIQALEPGECVVRLPGPWSHAMLGKIDYVPPCQGIQPQYDSNQHVPARHLKDLPELLEAIDQFSAAHNKAAERRARTEHGKLHAVARRLLAAAAEHPYWPVMALYRLIGAPSFEAQKTIRKQLTEGGYATFVDVRIGRRNLALIELKDAAWSLLGDPPISLRGGGELPHRCYANWLAFLGRHRGHEAVVEWTVPGTTHRVDTAWRVSANEWEVFEVVDTCDDNLQSHLRTIFLAPGSPVTTATIVAAQKRTLEGLKPQIVSHPEFRLVQDRIRYLPVEAVLKELWP
jgi:hypothetical protein